MKKIGVLFLLLICMLTACNQQVTNGSDKDITSSNGEDNDNDIYGLHDIPDEKFLIIENRKTFNELGVSVTVPIDWRCMESNGEDGNTYFFRDPKLGEKCQFVLSVTGSEYLNERTEKEYLEYLICIAGKDAQINSFTKEKVKGYESTKIVSSYSLDNTNFIRIDFDNIVVGVRCYDFTITYPASENETFDDVFESILNSVKFQSTE